jgi:hypothetical protein
MDKEKKAEYNRRYKQLHKKELIGAKVIKTELAPGHVRVEHTDLWKPFRERKVESH